MVKEIWIWTSPLEIEKRCFHLDRKFIQHWNTLGSWDFREDFVCIYIKRESERESCIRKWKFLFLCFWLEYVYRHDKRFYVKYRLGVITGEVVNDQKQNSIWRIKPPLPDTGFASGNSFPSIWDFSVRLNISRKKEISTYLFTSMYMH
jgi:hypothetical protein